jgi:hypothetical protein
MSANLVVRSEIHCDECVSDESAPMGPNMFSAQGSGWS